MDIFLPLLENLIKYIISSFSYSPVLYRFNPFFVIRNQGNSINCIKINFLYYRQCDSIKLSQRNYKNLSI